MDRKALSQATNHLNDAVSSLTKAMQALTDVGAYDRSTSLAGTINTVSALAMELMNTQATGNHN